MCDIFAHELLIGACPRFQHIVVPQCVDDDDDAGAGG